MGIRISPTHGVNPSLDICFYCQEARGVVLFGQFNPVRALGKELAATLDGPPGDRKAPDKIVMNKEPCDKCKEYMKKGIILISVDESKSDDRQNPWRTGGWVVVKEEAVRSFGIKSEELLEDICKTRLAFLPDDAWDKLGLPRGPVEGVPSE